MTPSELKREVEQTPSERFFFTPEAMRFFGDTMSNYGVRSAGKNWELYRKRPVKHGQKGSTYFDKKTFKRVWVGL